MGDHVQQSHSTRLRVWQVWTLILLVVGYSGFYLCRSNLSVATPEIISEREAQGMPRDDARDQLGLIVTFGTAAYAVGKFLSGGVGDLLGGRRNFLGGMAGAVAFTTLFALGGAFPIFTFAWMANRLVQSAGWSGMVKISGRWFDYRSHGTVLAILSLSYLYGDAAGKAFNGWLLNQRLGWRNVFFVDAAILGSLFLISFWLLKESPRVIGAPEGTPNPNNVYASAEDDPNQFGWLGILKPLLARPSFWFACLISLCLTFVRETFNTWNSTYFTESIRLEIGPAAYWSAAFSFLGGCSVLLAGFASDWLGRTGRAIIIFVGPLFAGIALLFLSGLDATTAAAGAIALVLIVGFFMLGPYSYLSGAVSLDFGGKRGSATACGIIDGVGYLGGILAGYAVARLVRAHGWPTTFGVLAGVTLVSCVFAALFLIAQIRQGGRAQVERDGAR